METLQGTSGSGIREGGTIKDMIGYITSAKTIITK
jgi:hypothetical protein